MYEAVDARTPPPISGWSNIKNDTSQVFISACVHFGDMLDLYFDVESEPKKTTLRQSRLRWVTSWPSARKFRKLYLSGIMADNFPNRLLGPVFGPVQPYVKHNVDSGNTIIHVASQMNVSVKWGHLESLARIYPKFVDLTGGLIIYMKKLALQIWFKGKWVLEISRYNSFRIFKTINIKTFQVRDNWFLSSYSKLQKAQLICEVSDLLKLNMNSIEKRITS